MALTLKQRLFIAEYLIDGNASRAAIAAGYSEKTAGSIGHENLQKPEIASEIEKRAIKRAEKLDITADRVLAEIGKLAFLDPRKFFREDGTPKQIEELDDETAMSLAGMEVLEQFEGSGDDRKFVGYVKKYKLADKGQNLERLGRYFKMFTDKVEQSGDEKVRIVLIGADSVARA